jgi:glycine cleavage system H protein
MIRYSVYLIPIQGKILKVNESLEGEPSLLNQSPYEKGWIAEIEMTNKDELDDLLSEEDYNKLIQ